MILSIIFWVLAASASLWAVLLNILAITWVFDRVRKVFWRDKSAIVVKK